MGAMRVEWVGGLWSQWHLGNMWVILIKGIVVGGIFRKYAV